MPKYNRHLKIDKNIINAVNSLPLLMKNKEGDLIKLRKSNTRETREEHIADSTHGLQVKDIKAVPKILLNPYARLIDPVHPRRINYYGVKYKSNKFCCYIKIVTTKNKLNEEIITIYLTNKIKYK